MFHMLCCIKYWGLHSAMEIAPLWYFPGRPGAQVLKALHVVLVLDQGVHIQTQDLQRHHRHRIIPWMFHRQVMMIKQPPCVVHKRNPGWWFIYGLYMVYIWFIYIYIIYIYIYQYIYYYIYLLYIIYIFILYIYILYIIYIYTGWWFQPTPLKNDGVNVRWDYEIPTEWNVIKHVPNHQPEPEFLCDSTDF